ncbi:Alpha-terpineol synthase, chloroplastic [Apostasia shenzhenica]|uniref:Alpha-terpineol synthase, chloroplastic n=1 Tax=Apostasia shenzhenica TaxID=1088818 RepID=A0A2I0B0V2_9ASPA|nr:Alpha-terpineol synthase, chloroplastic [Apostasia shenzhenica]
MPRLHTRWFIDFYENQENNVHANLLELAKLDFNMVQSMHKMELKRMSRWWKELGLVCDELGFARNRLVEHYFWTVGYTFEPQFGSSREAITKTNCLITTIDDIYDVFGTLNELELFTKAIREWIDLCNAYLMEARWYYTGYTASLNEYLQNAWVSISGHLILSTAYCSSKDLTVETLSNFKFYPNALRHSSMLFRLYDDLGTAKTEMQRGDVQKSIQCHMNEKKVSELEARHYFKNCLIRKYWKALNQEFLSNFGFVEAFKAALLGMPRMAQCMYQFGDGHSEPNLETKDRVIKLLIEPIPI